MTLGSRPASPCWTTTVETDRPLAWVCSTEIDDPSGRPCTHSSVVNDPLTADAPHELSLRGSPARRGSSLPRSEDELKRISLSSRRTLLSLDRDVRSRHDGGMIGFSAAGVQVTLDDDTLREVVEDSEALTAWCTDNPEDPRAVDYLRMLGRLDEAAIVGRRTLEPTALPALVRAVRRTRYAHVLQWQGAFASAEEQFDLAAEETGLDDPTSPSSLSVLSSVFHQRAKCRFEHALALRDQGRDEKGAALRISALEDARRALFMRENLTGIEELALEASRQTVSRLERTTD
jgi:hypothetical protein